MEQRPGLLNSVGDTSRSKGLVTNYGEGGYKTFYPHKKGGGEVLAMLKGGTISFGVVFMQ